MGVPDEIRFSVIFNGEDTDNMGLLSALPTIVDQLKIHGGECDTDAGVKGPCVSVQRAGGALFVVEDDDVEIQGMGLMGAGTAINVTNASERFVARGNWIGFNLAGFPGVGAVTSENGESFKALHNQIGFGSDGSTVTPPSSKGIFVLGQAVSEEANVEFNAVRAGSIGINNVGLTGRIVGNELEGGSTGILAGFGDGEGLIASNEIDAPGEFGILIESAKNDVRDNTVTNSSGAGIAVKPPFGGTATIGNVIGGSATNTENVIDGSTGPAIEIAEEAGEPGSWTEITRNHGSSVDSGRDDRRRHPDQGKRRHLRALDRNRACGPEQRRGWRQWRWQRQRRRRTEPCPSRAAARRRPTGS